MAIQRYDIYWDLSRTPGLEEEEDPDGEWVKYEDVKDLLGEGWTKFSDKMPPQSVELVGWYWDPSVGDVYGKLVYLKGGSWEILDFEHDGQTVYPGHEYTYWMRVPNPPEFHMIEGN